MKPWQRHKKWHPPEQSPGDGDIDRDSLAWRKAAGTIAGAALGGPSAGVSANRTWRKGHEGYETVRVKHPGVPGWRHG